MTKFKSLRRRSMYFTLASLIALSGFVWWRPHKAQAQTIFLTNTATTSWSVPSDWNNSNNTIEVIGGGGGGDQNKTNGSPSSKYGGGGGGGGAYSKATNVTLPAGSSVTIKIGTGGTTALAGGDTYVCNSTSNCAGITGTAVLAGAKGGGGGSTSTGGSGGQASTSVGTAVNGGNGGAGGTSGTTTCGGGGGAGGMNGAGNGGGSGAGGTDGAGGSGDAGYGGPADSSGSEWDIAHGSGGGMSGSSLGIGGSTILYGGGGGGGSGGGGSGGQGVIVITYNQPAHTYIQAGYRWLASSGTTTPGSALAANNTAYTLTSAGQQVRLRGLVRSSGTDSAGYHNFNLQYASLGANPNCSAISSGSWSNVGNNSTVIDSYGQANFNSSNSVSEGQGYGQSFTGNGYILTAAQFYIGANSGSTGNLYARIYIDSGTYGTSSVPSGSYIATSDAKDISTVGSSQSMVSFTFSGANQILLANNSHYIVTLEYPVGSGVVGSYALGTDTTSPTHSGNFVSGGSGGWGADNTTDAIFSVNSSPSTTPIQFYDNATPASGDSISSSGGDPSDSGQTVTAMTYAESNGFTNNNSYGGTVDGMWDLSLYDNGAPSGTTYCFRFVNPDGSALSSYSFYPQLTTASSNSPPSTPTLTAPSSGATGVSTTPAFSFSDTDPDSDDIQFTLNLFQLDCSTAVSGYPLSMSAGQTGWSPTFNGTAGSGLTYTSSTSGSGVTYTPSSALANSTTYCWSVSAKDPGGSNSTTTSGTRSFTTAAGVTQQVNVGGGVNITGGTNIY